MKNKNMFIYIYRFNSGHFYIGVCADLLCRLRWHYASGCMPISKILCIRRSIGEFPIIQILGYYDKPFALLKEKELIRKMASKMMLNYQYNVLFDKSLTENIPIQYMGLTPSNSKIPSHIRKQIKQIQLNYLSQYGNYEKRIHLVHATTVG